MDRELLKKGLEQLQRNYQAFKSVNRKDRYDYPRSFGNSEESRKLLSQLRDSLENK